MLVPVNTPDGEHVRYGLKEIGGGIAVGGFWIGLGIAIAGVFG